jgi:hypothetical protein
MMIVAAFGPQGFALRTRFRVFRQLDSSSHAKEEHGCIPKF